jgi:hypothetical protein
LLALHFAAQNADKNRLRCDKQMAEITLHPAALLDELP